MRCDVNCPGNEGDDKLRDELNKFWNVESIGEERGDCVIHEFERDIVHNGTRYVTKLPFRPDHDILPDNFLASKGRLNSLQKRLKTADNKNLLHEYDNIFQDYEKSGIIERVPEQEMAKQPGNVYYLPHRPVIRTDKQTTKIRAVFDASYSTNKPSLNDCLYPSPNLLTKIFDILIRFRMNYIALLADIKQAFLNIEISSEHIDFLRFLWLDDLTEEDAKIVIFRFLRVVFGINSSPFLLNGTIWHHLEKYIEFEREFVGRFIEDLYVDDEVSGCETVEEGLEFYRKAKQIMSVEWDTENDQFIFRFEEFVKMALDLIPTKRNILRIAASLYDPLGLISPITTRVKIIFQKLCQDKYEWDDIVSDEIKSIWTVFLTELRNLNLLRIKRYALIEIKHHIKSIELHGFSDSSKQAYSGVVYMRIKTNLGIRLSLLASKSKVAPLKALTIPRLELLGCSLLTKLLREVKLSISERVKIDHVYGWTDSEVALCWIKGKCKVWKPWVENRVVIIREILCCDQWNHVVSGDNPADIPTRLNCFDALAWDMWLHGPEFLRCEYFVLPRFDVEEKLILSEVIEESKKNCEVVTNVVGIGDEVLISNVKKDLGLRNIINAGRYSSLKKLITITGYVLRFVNNLLSKMKKNHEQVSTEEELTVNEFNYAYNLWIKDEQAQLSEQSNRHFPNLFKISC